MRIESWSYQAALYCDDCRPDNGCKDPEGCDDSDCCPQPNFSSESDSPDHCSACNVFLKNALTGDGMDYVRESLCDGSGDREVEAEWRDYYELDKPRNWPVRSVRIEDLAEALAERYRGIYGLYKAADTHATYIDDSATERAFTAKELYSWIHSAWLGSSQCLNPATCEKQCAEYMPPRTFKKDLAVEILYEDFRIEIIDPHATCADQTEETCNADRCVP